MFRAISFTIELTEFIDDPSVTNGIDVAVTGVMGVESFMLLAGKSTGLLGWILYGSWKSVVTLGSEAWKFYESLDPKERWNNHWGLTWEDPPE